MVSGFFTKRTNPYIIVEWVCLSRERASRASYSFLLLIVLLNIDFLKNNYSFEYLFFAFDFLTCKKQDIIYKDSDHLHSDQWRYISLRLHPETKLLLQSYTKELTKYIFKVLHFSTLSYTLPYKCKSMPFWKADCNYVSSLNNICTL